MADAELPGGTTWAFEAAADVVHVAVSPGAPWSLVADASRRVHILDEAGAVQGQFRAGQPIRKVRSDQRGNVFVALAGQGVLYAFNSKGELEWRVELPGTITDFDLGSLGELVAAVSIDGALCLYSPSRRDRRIAALGKPLAYVSLIDGERPRVVVANQDGHVAMLGGTDDAQWSTELEGRLTGVFLSAESGTLGVSVQGRGMLLFDLAGAEKGQVEFPGPVQRAVLSPDGLEAMAELADGQLVLARADSAVVWQHGLGGPPVAWSWGWHGRLVVAATGGARVGAWRVLEAGPKPEAAPPAAQPAKPAAPPPAEAVALPEYLEAETALAGHAPGVSVAERRKSPVVWKKKLPQGAAPVEEGLFRLSQDAGYLLAGLGDGTLVALNAAGDMTVSTRVETPVRTAPSVLGGHVAVWSPRQVLVLEPAVGGSRVVPLDLAGVQFLDCSSDANLFATLTGSGGLRAWRGGEAAWEATITQRPAAVMVSPSDETVLVADVEGRFRYYNWQGKLVHKFKFATDGPHRVLALGDGLSVFCDGQGLVTVLDAFWKEAWVGRLFRTVVSAELLGRNLALYGQDGACAVVDPDRGEACPVALPPGRARVRPGTQGQAVAVHAAERMVSVVSGRRRELSVLWQYRCADDIAALDSDASARVIVVAAGERIYRMEQAFLLES